MDRNRASIEVTVAVKQNVSLIVEFLSFLESVKLDGAIILILQVVYASPNRCVLLPFNLILLLIKFYPGEIGVARQRKPQSKFPRGHIYCGEA
jgi:hypothetical protein